MTQTLYNGTVTLEFKDKPYHQYLVNGKKVPSVTTILKVISKGDALLQWGVNQTLEYLAARLEGELSTEEVRQLLLDAKFAHRTKKEEAATIGTTAHRWIEAHLRGNTPDALPENEAAANSIRAALAWLDRHQYRTIDVEKRIYSRSHIYSGTCDWVASVDGRLLVPDWKTSKAIWEEYRFQTAAYVAAIQEESGLPIEGRVLIRIDKETGEFEDLFLPQEDQEKDFNAFLGAQMIYLRQKELKPRKKKGPNETAQIPPSFQPYQYAEGESQHLDSSPERSVHSSEGSPG